MDKGRTGLEVVIGSIVMLAVSEQMRNVRTDQGEISSLEMTDMVANESGTSTFINQYQLVFLVKMPWIREIFAVQVLI